MQIEASDGIGRITARTSQHSLSAILRSFIVVDRYVEHNRDAVLARLELVQTRVYVRVEFDVVALFGQQARRVRLQADHIGNTV